MINYYANQFHYLAVCQSCFKGNQLLTTIVIQRQQKKKKRNARLIAKQHVPDSAC